MRWAKSVKWLKLEIVNTSNGKQKDNNGTVTFNAHFIEHGKKDVIHEKICFCKRK